MPSLSTLLGQIRYAAQKWDDSAWWRQEREILSLYPYERGVLPHPTLAQLREIVYDGKEHWEECDIVCLDWFRSAQGKTYLNVLKHRPGLFFFYQEPHGIFFQFREVGGEEFVPLVPKENTEPVTRSIGGTDTHFPATAFVSREVAWEIVQKFVFTQRRAKVVTWVAAENFHS